MNLKAGYPYSLVRSGMPSDYPKLDKDLKTDVLVLGGGISGALASHYLVRAGVKCVVVDGRTIGLGSTCASTSLLQYEIDTKLHELVDLVGAKNAVRAYKLCEQSIFELEKLAARIGFEDFERKKSFYFAADDKDIPSLKKEYTIRKKAGFDVKWLNASAIARQFKFEAPGGILSSVAAITDAYLFTHKLFEYNTARGLKVYDRSPVKKIVHGKKSVNVWLENGCRITAKKIVYATGYEVVDFISQPIVKLQSTYAIVSETFNKEPAVGKKDTLIWNTADPYLYMRTTADRRIIVGGRDEEFQSPARRDKLLVRKANQLKKDFNKLYPDIEFNTEFSWTGTFGSTKDGLPYIGHYKKLPNSFFALGFGGNGITFSQVAGKILADLVRGIPHKDAALFSFDR